MRVPVKVLMGKIINIHGELSIVMLDYGSRRVFLHVYLQRPRLDGKISVKDVNNGWSSI